MWLVNPTNDNEIHKQSGASVSTDLFLSNEYSCISGIIYSPYSSREILGLPADELGSEFSYVHNRQANCVLPPGWLRTRCEYWHCADANCIVRVAVP